MIDLNSVQEQYGAASQGASDIPTIEKDNDQLAHVPGKTRLATRFDYRDAGLSGGKQSGFRAHLM